MFSASGNRQGTSERAAQLLGWAMAYKASDAIELLIASGVSGALHDRPRECGEVARELALAEPALRTLMNFCVRIGLLERSGDDYALSASARTMLPLLEHELATRRWHRDNDSLRKVLSCGAPQDPMIDASPETRRLYDRALSSFTRGLALAIRRLNLPPNLFVVDLGGGDGALAVELRRLDVADRITVVDRPYVGRHFEARLATAPTSLTFVGADLTDPDALGALLGQADLIILSNVVHLLTPSQRERLWRTLARDCRAEATVLVYDQFPSGQEGPGTEDVSASELMIIDWLRCGVMFDLSPEEQGAEMTAHGLATEKIVSSPILPGKMILSHPRHRPEAS